MANRWRKLYIPHPAASGGAGSGKTLRNAQTDKTGG